MPDVTSKARPATARDFLYLRSPKLWTVWPFLPLVRRRADGELDYGVLYDCWTVARRGGLSATVWLTNLFAMPPTEDEFLKLPREVYDTIEEVVAAGWRVD